MQGSSRLAAGAVSQRFSALLDRGDVDRGRLGEDLFSILDTIESNIPLRRALSDPSRDGEAKTQLAQRLYGGKVSDPAVELTGDVVAQRWSRDRDLTDTLENLAVGSLVAAAEQQGRADQVEDELFRFERIVAGNRELRDAVTDRRASGQSKAELVGRLLEGKASGETLRLARQSVLRPRGRRFDQVIDAYLAEAGKRRDQLTALVTTAIVLDESQRERLVAALSRHYSKQVHLNVVLDQAVIGGIRVQVGDDVIDGTILRRLDEARRHMGA